MPQRALSCPWQNFPTHSKNRELQVDGDRPIVFGYCPQTDGCASCAGTGFKPNILLQQGRAFDFVPCPYCRPADFKKKAERINAKRRR